MSHMDRAALERQRAIAEAQMALAYAMGSRHDEIYWHSEEKRLYEAIEALNQQARPVTPQRALERGEK